MAILIILVPGTADVLARMPVYGTGFRGRPAGHPHRNRGTRAAGKEKVPAFYAYTSSIPHPDEVEYSVWETGYTGRWDLEIQLPGRESMLRMPVPEESSGLKEGEMASIKDTHDRQDGVITAALFTAGFAIGGTETKEEI